MCTEALAHISWYHPFLVSKRATKESRVDKLVWLALDMTGQTDPVIDGGCSWMPQFPFFFFYKMEILKHSWMEMER